MTSFGRDTKQIPSLLICLACAAWGARGRGRWGLLLGCRRRRWCVGVWSAVPSVSGWVCCRCFRFLGPPRSSRCAVVLLAPVLSWAVPLLACARSCSCWLASRFFLLSSPLPCCLRLPVLCAHEGICLVSRYKLRCAEVKSHSEGFLLVSSDVRSLCNEAFEATVIMPDANLGSQSVLCYLALCDLRGASKQNSPSII